MSLILLRGEGPRPVGGPAFLNTQLTHRPDRLVAPRGLFRDGRPSLQGAPSGVRTHPSCCRCGVKGRSEISRREIHLFGTFEAKSSNVQALERCLPVRVRSVAEWVIRVGGCRRRAFCLFPPLPNFFGQRNAIALLLSQRHGNAHLPRDGAVHALRARERTVRHEPVLISYVGDTFCYGSQKTCGQGQTLADVGRSQQHGCHHKRGSVSVERVMAQ